MDSRKIAKLNSQPWKHLSYMTWELLNFDDYVGMDNGLPGVTRADKRLEDPNVCLCVRSLDDWIIMREEAQ